MSGVRWWWAWIAVVVVIALGSVLDVMEVDAAQYAEMSRQLALSGDWSQFHWRGHDYLDKPPLLFWLSALSFKLFGVHNLSYKLPSILAAFAGVYALYRFTRFFHPVEVARLAALFFATSAAFVLMNNDVRCDTLLTAFILIAIWQGAEYQVGRKWKHLIGCSVGIALAMLAKGPIGLIAPLMALVPPLLLRKQWRAFADARMWIAAPIIALLLLPMCVGLYQQFGMHGLRFFLWDQSFGRITGTNRWQDDSSPFYFTHEILWLLLPWTLFALVGLWKDLRSWIRSRADGPPELISICGALGVLAIMSLSHYKLPHYIYPVVPLLCVVAAREAQRAGKWLIHLQNALMVLLLLGTGWFAKDALGDDGFFWSAGVGVVALVVVVLWFSRVKKGALVLITLVSAIACALVLNTGIYPRLLEYQANAEIGKWIRDNEADVSQLIGFRNGGAALDFYAGAEVRWVNGIEEMRALVHEGSIVYADMDGLGELERAGLVPKRSSLHVDYPIQTLSFDFLGEGTRTDVLNKRYLLFY